MEKTKEYTESCTENCTESHAESCTEGYTEDCCPMQAQVKNTNIEEELKLDEYYYMPEELWPEDATDIRREPCYLWYRHSQWKRVEAVNEENKKLMDECIDFYKKKRPECEDPLNDETFWLRCVGDNIISNSIEHRDYIYENDYKNGNDFKKALKQFDVVIQETLGGFVCHPFVVYDIEYRNAYEAKIKYDDYARIELDKIDAKYENNLEGWRAGGNMEWKMKRAEFIKEGHATYEVKSGGTEYRMNMRWIDRSNTKNPQPYGTLHKGVY